MGIVHGAILLCYACEMQQGRVFQTSIKVRLVGIRNGRTGAFCRLADLPMVLFRGECRNSETKAAVFGFES